MSIATARQQCAPAAAPMVTCVVGADEPARKRFARMLGEAGFNVDVSVPTERTALILRTFAHRSGDQDRGSRAWVRSHDSPVRQ